MTEANMIDAEWFAANPDRLPEWVAELVKARVDVIVTVGDLAIRTAQEATKTIPIRRYRRSQEGRLRFVRQTRYRQGRYAQHQGTAWPAK